jgi:hypothetical protein
MASSPKMAALSESASMVKGTEWRNRAGCALSFLPVSAEPVSINDTLRDRDRLEDFAAAFAGKEAEVEAFLIARKQIEPGHTWRVAAEYFEERVAGKIPAFLQAVAEFSKQQQPEAKAA